MFGKFRVTVHHKDGSYTHGPVHDSYAEAMHEGNLIHQLASKHFPYGESYVEKQNPLFDVWSEIRGTRREF